MLHIGITGGIGSGKSLICRIFQTLGIPVYEADLRARALMQTDEALMADIRSHFGSEAYQDGLLNRSYIAAQVFGRPERLALLNHLVHPKVGEDFARWSREQDGKAPYVLKEAALLFETGSYKELDEVIVVIAPLDLRITRIRRRDVSRSEDEIRQIIARQWSDEQRIALNPHVIHNGEGDAVLSQVLALDQRFRQASPNPPAPDIVGGILA